VWVGLVWAKGEGKHVNSIVYIEGKIGRKWVNGSRDHHARWFPSI
jgi:hypothetical protein